MGRAVNGGWKNYNVCTANCYLKKFHKNDEFCLEFLPVA
jgi:hypothetical protein